MDIIVISSEKLNELIEQAVVKVLQQLKQQEKQQTYLSKKEAAKHLGICFNTLQKYIAKGWITPTVNGKILLSEVEAMQRRKK